MILLLSAGTALDAQWAKAYGGEGDDWANDVQLAPGGGFIVAGGTRSYLANAQFTKSYWIIKLDGDGTVLWQKLDTQPYSSPSGSEILSIRTAKDNKIAALVNYFYSGCNYFQVLKFDKNGKEGSGFFQVYRTEHSARDASTYSSLGTLEDGGFIIAGRHVGPSDRTGGMIIHRLNKSGWSRYMIKPDGPGEDYGCETAPTRDGGAAVAGVTKSFGTGEADVWLLKLTPRGRIQWQFTYGGTGQDLVYDVQQTSDGGYVLLGQTDSSGMRRWDLWVLKLDKNGNIQWEKTYGGVNGDYAHSIRQTRDGGYIAAGTTYSFGDVMGDAWVFKLDREGEIVWQNRYGGDRYDGAWAVREIPLAFGGGYIVAGKTTSFGVGGDDVLVLKLAEDGSIDPSCGILINPTAASAKRIHSAAHATTVQVSGGPIGAFYNRYKAGTNQNTEQTVICKK